MTFILGDQLDADANIARALYDKYVEENRRHFPKSAIELMQHPDWWGGGAYSRCPHDGKVSGVKVDVADHDSRIELTIAKPGGDVEIQIVYSGVVEFDLPKQRVNLWSYDQFKFYNPYHDHGIKETNMFQHEIEWVSQVVWTIRAKEIAVVWRDI